MLLALAMLEDWHIHQMDVKSAFLNGKLEEEIYMEQPKGFIIAGQETQVCCLKKALYGLKQASRTWNLQFHGVLVGLGFTQTHADASVYVCHQHGGEGIQIIILYVDDITLLGTSLEGIECTKKQLSDRYEMTDMGEIKSYLGMRIVRDQGNRCIEIDQSGYIIDIVNVTIPLLDPSTRDEEEPNYDEEAQVWAAAMEHAAGVEGEEMPDEYDWQISHLVSAATYTAGPDTGRVSTGRMKVT